MWYNEIKEVWKVKNIKNEAKIWWQKNYKRFLSGVVVVALMVKDCFKAKYDGKLGVSEIKKIVVSRMESLDKIEE